MKIAWCSNFNCELSLEMFDPARLISTCSLWVSKRTHDSDFLFLSRDTQHMPSDLLIFYCLLNSFLCFFAQSPGFWPVSIDMHIASVWNCTYFQPGRCILCILKFQTAEQFQMKQPLQIDFRVINKHKMPILPQCNSTKTD